MTCNIFAAPTESEIFNAIQVQILWDIALEAFDNFNIFHTFMTFIEFQRKWQ